MTPPRNTRARLMQAREWLLDGDTLEADSILRDLEDEWERYENEADYDE